MIGVGESGKISVVDGKVDSIKAKTDNLPADPASTGDITTVDGKVDSIKAKTDNLPADPVGTSDLSVPSQNSADNISIVDVIGNKTDTLAGTSITALLKKISDIIGDKESLVAVPYVAGINDLMAFIVTGYYHVHGASFIYPDKADPVLVSSSAAEWSETGTVVEVIPANAIKKPFDLHWCSIWDVSNALYGVVDIFAGPAENLVKIGAVDVGRTANFSRESAMPVQVPQQPANTRISVRLSDNTTSVRSVKLKFYGHVYSSTLT